LARRRIAVVLEGGPGAGKTSTARMLAEILRRQGLRPCIVDDAARTLSSIFTRLFGEWHNAPRMLIEYVFLGYQLCRLRACSDADVVILDYSIEAPLAYMEADGIDYPGELDDIGFEVLRGFDEVYFFVLEQPCSYGLDEARWEPPRRAARYARALFRRAAVLARRLDAPLYVLPERSDAGERARLIAEILAAHSRSPRGGAGGVGVEGGTKRG